MNKADVVGLMGYDENVKRKSLENPIKQHRRSSIPYADRTPAVRYIMSIDKRKASVAGPYDPTKRDPNKPILKKQTPSQHDGIDGNANAPNGVSSSTNDELETCRSKTELIMEVLTKADRITRGSMDILSFPPVSNQLEVLSRFQGCMTVSVCTIDTLSSSTEYKNKRKSSAEFTNLLSSIMTNVTDLQKEAEKLSSTAHKLHSVVKQRIQEWDTILKKNSDFHVEETKIDYPIYSRKSMPECATMFEHFIDEDNRYPVEGYCSITRTLPQDVIHLHCEDFDNSKLGDELDFVTCSVDKQVDIISVLTSHVKDLVQCSSSYMNQGLETLQNKQIDEAFSWIQSRLGKLQYDVTYDPLCALELKNVFAEVAVRKAELLNISIHILSHVKWVVGFSGTFLRFTKQSLYGGGLLSCCNSCSKEKLLGQIGPVANVGLQIFLPLSNTIAETVFELKKVQNSKTTVASKTAMAS